MDQDQQANDKYSRYISHSGVKSPEKDHVLEMARFYVRTAVTLFKIAARKAFSRLEGKEYQEDGDLWITTKFRVFRSLGLGYEAEKAKPLYKNTHLGLSEGEYPKNPPFNSLLIVVNPHCFFCQTFLKLTNYQTETPDGRPILYVNIESEEGQTYLKSLGYEAGGKDIKSTVLVEPTLNGQPVPVQSGGVLHRGIMPVAINVDKAGKLENVAFAGPSGGFRWFKDMQARFAPHTPQKTPTIVRGEHLALVCAS